MIDDKAQDAIMEAYEKTILNERLGEKGRTKPENWDKRGVSKLKMAVDNIELAIKKLADARKFEIYTPEGIKASKEEIQDLITLKKELTARIQNLS